MKKDIFVDTNLAKNLSNPITDPFKQFIDWLYKEGTLVINKSLLSEFISGNQTLAAVLNRLQIDGRTNDIKNEDLKKFKFSKGEEKKLISNYKDRNHLKSVFLSDRKLALSLDINFSKDVNGYKKINGIQPNCKNCPSLLEYNK